MKNVILVTHATEVFGPPGALKDYLKAKVKVLIYIFHPLDETVKLASTAQVFQNGKLINQKRLPKFFQRFSYLGHFLGTIYFGLNFAGRQNFDYFIGANNFNCLAGIVLKRLIKIKKVVFYTVDYSPVRFKKRFSDWFYQQFDRWALRWADFVWSNNQRVAALRRRQGLPDAKSLLAPNGVCLKSIPKSNTAKKSAIVKFVFQGHLTKTKGTQELIKAFAAVNQRHQNWRLTIIGSGPFEKNLRQLVIRQKLNDKIKFVGWLPNQKVLEKMVKYDVGVALYNEADSYTKYCDPLKVKEYLACGLAVLMTNVPYITNFIRQKKLGLVIKPKNQRALQQALTEIMINRKELRAWQKNARCLAKDFDWQIIFDSVFAKMETR